MKTKTGVPDEYTVAMVRGLLQQWPALQALRYELPEVWSRMFADIELRTKRLPIHGQIVRRTMMLHGEIAIDSKTVMLPEVNSVRVDLVYILNVEGLA